MLTFNLYFSVLYNDSPDPVDPPTPDDHEW